MMTPRRAVLLASIVLLFGANACVCVAEPGAKAEWDQVVNRALEAMRTARESIPSGRGAGTEEFKVDALGLPPGARIIDTRFKPHEKIVVGSPGVDVSTCRCSKKWLANGRRRSGLSVFLLGSSDLKMGIAGEVDPGARQQMRSSLVSVFWQVTRRLMNPVEERVSRPSPVPQPAAPAEQSPLLADRAKRLR